MFQLSLLVLLSVLAVMPQIDQKLGNPYLPFEAEAYAFQELEMIDFTLQPDLLAFGHKLEE